VQVKWPPARTGRLKLATVRSEVGAELESESVDARRRALIVDLVHSQADGQRVSRPDVQVKWPPARTGRLKLAAVRSEVGAELESESVDARRRALIVNLAKTDRVPGPTGTRRAMAGRFPSRCASEAATSADRLPGGCGGPVRRGR